MKLKRTLIYIFIFLLGVAMGRYVLSRYTFLTDVAREQVVLMDELNETLVEFHGEIDRAWGEEK